MASGGARTGTPGKAYPNRTDMQLNRAAPGQTYGKAAAQERALSAVPASAPPDPGSAGAGTPSPMQQALDGWEPLAGSPMESARPDEPVTAGIDSGAGPGSEILPTISPQSPDLQRLFTWLPALERMASAPGSSAATRSLFRQVYTAYLAQPQQ